jgi:phosphate transport system substrate-binding protein
MFIALNKFIIFSIIFVLYLSNINAYNQIRAVGSSSVYPIITIIGENFGKKYPQFKAPIVESNGTGAGFNLFCASYTPSSPSISNASRKIKKEERALCKSNDIVDIIEIPIGFDAIAIVQPNTLVQLNLTKKDIFLALAKKVPDSRGNLIDNPYKTWRDVSEKLPNIPIKVMGPPSSSGTRDVFLDLVMKSACNKMYEEKKITDTSIKKEIACTGIRSDGPWINGGENDILLIRKVSQSIDTLAILADNFYVQNKDKVGAVMIDGVALTEENIRDRKYSLVRGLFVYIKAEDLDLVAGLKEFFVELTKETTIGEKTYLSKIGLIGLTKKEYNQFIPLLKNKYIEK